MGDFVHIPTVTPPPKNLVFQHEVTNPNPTSTLGERKGRGGARALSINFALQCEPCNPNHTSPTRHPIKQRFILRNLPMPTYTCYAPVHLSRHWPRFSQPYTTTKKTDHEERLTTKNNWPRRLTTTTKKTDHEEDWPQYISALFWLTRTYPCATFDIHGHVWAESFVV